MKLDLYSNILPKLLRRFPSEQRMCLSFIAIVAEARVIASQTNTMELNVISSALDNLSMDADSVSAFCTDKVSDLLLSNLDNTVFKNSIDIANDFIDAVNNRFGLEYSHLVEASSEDDVDTEVEKTFTETKSVDLIEELGKKEDNFVSLIVEDASKEPAIIEQENAPTEDDLDYAEEDEEDFVDEEFSSEDEEDDDSEADEDSEAEEEVKEEVIKVTSNNVPNPNFKKKNKHKHR